jgi:hypothetical protein
MTVTTDYSQKGETRFHVDTVDRRQLAIIITHEGIIMDVFSKIGYDMEHEHLGTVGMMFDEWADWIVGSGG